MAEAGLDDIMAALDVNQAPPVLNNEKSAFEQDDDGDLDSDIDGDGP